MEVRISWGVALWLLMSSACSVPDQRFLATDATTSDGPRGDAPIDATPCLEGSTRCDGNVVTTCTGGAWQPKRTCDDLCSLGGCVIPTSCAGGLATCGAGTESCCATRPLPTTTFARSFDGVTSGYTDARYQATITAFTLDRFEVSADRFQRFVDAYPANKPTVGAGANPHDTSDAGWLAAWTTALPATQADLRTMWKCDSVTAQSGSVPTRCVTWYVAQAFCIWDGGRLPTEAEWNVAAAGGEQQRVYPWSSPPATTAIDATDAVYNGAVGPGSVGARAAGDGRWGHADLAGNVDEWVLDTYASPYPTETCHDCANHAAGTTRTIRGGDYGSVGAVLIASYRTDYPAASRSELVGFRCAHDPIPEAP